MLIRSFIYLPCLSQRCFFLDLCYYATRRDKVYMEFRAGPHVEGGLGHTLKMWLANLGLDLTLKEWGDNLRLDLMLNG